MSKKSRRPARPEAPRAASPEPVPGLGSRRTALVIAALLLVAAAQYSWNAFTIGGLVGYDARHHIEYVLTLVHKGQLPHPLEGWSTFHPPLYYALGSVVWSTFRPLGITTAIASVRELSALAMLTAGLASFLLALRLGGGLAVAGVATALVLFVPCSRLAASAIGNEALGAGLAGLALLALVRLQGEPRNLRVAGVAGLMAGLALATKYTGFFVATACVVPFCRADFDRRMLRALALCAVAGALVAGPVYVRNIVLTGSPVPMTRNLEPMKSAEDGFIIRERRVWDYLWVNPGSLWRPTIFQVKGREGSLENRNPAMTNIWGLAYASVWYDAFRHRISIEFHRDGIYSGRVLTLLGLVPTALVIAGFVVALRELIRRRGRTSDAPLVVMAGAGLLTFIAFTIRAPSAVAVKASYMLPLVVPAAAFFTRGVGLLSPRARIAALLISSLAALAAAAVFTNGLIFPFLETQH